MSEAVDLELAARVALKTDELVDWVETDVITQTQHPYGWEIWFTGADDEPATPEAVLYRTDSLREAWAMAKADQERVLAGGEVMGGDAPVADPAHDADAEVG